MMIAIAPEGCDAVALIALSDVEVLLMVYQVVFAVLLAY
jgi:hypothetical protein